MPNANNYMAAGCMAFCSVGCIVFGIFLLFPGAVLTGLANNRSGGFKDEFFDDSYNAFGTAGPILLVIGFMLIGTGIVLCICVKKKMEAQNSRSGSTTYTATTVIPGAGYQNPYGPPQHAQYPGAQYPQQQYPPPGQQYPPTGQPYPPAGQPYPPTGQPYPPQGQPYPPQGQYAANQPYPQPYTGGQAPYPTHSAPPADPSAPPSYDDAIRHDK